MLDQYSIAEMRNHFAALVRDVEEKEAAVAVTRHGKMVAVLLSADEYHRLQEAAEQRDFWSAYQSFRQRWVNEEMAAEEDVWADVRDKETGSEENAWR